MHNIKLQVVRVFGAKQLVTKLLSAIYSDGAEHVLLQPAVICLIMNSYDLEQHQELSAKGGATYDTLLNKHRTRQSIIFQNLFLFIGINR